MFILSHQHEIIAVQGSFASVDSVGIQHDSALCALAVNFSQAGCKEKVTVDKVRQHIARSHRRQLVSITYQNQPRARFEGIAKRLCQHQVKHRGLVNYDCVIIEGIFGVFAEAHVPRLFVVKILQQAVYRTGRVSAGLHNSFGGSACRSGHGHLQSAFFHYVEQ